MSEENVEVVRSSMEAFKQGGFSRTNLWTENATLTAPPGWPEQGPFEGREAILRQFKRLASDWSKHAFSDVEVVSAEGDWVVLAYRWEAQGAVSGLDTGVDMAAAYRIKDGEIAEGHFRWNRAEALEAAGLSE